MRGWQYTYVFMYGGRTNFGGTETDNSLLTTVLYKPTSHTTDINIHIHYKVHTYVCTYAPTHIHTHGCVLRMLTTVGMCTYCSVTYLRT